MKFEGKFWLKGSGKSMVVLLLILLAAVYTDYRQKRIPNWIIVFGITSGLVISLLHGGIGLLCEGIGGMILPVILLYPAFAIGGLGAGDLKLFAVAGSYLGIKGITNSIIIAFVLGAMISLVKMIRFHNFKERIYYFFSYVTDIFLKGKWRLYELTDGQALDESKVSDDSLDFPNHKIHFALPILLGVVIYIGGVL